MIDVFRFPFNEIFNLLNIGKTEILLFLPVYHMFRFLKPTQEDEQNPSYKHIKRIMDEFELNYDVNNIDEYIERITHSLTFNNNFFVTNFKLKKDGSANTYALFFITQHIKGLEKAIEAKWEIDDECGKGYQYKDYGLFADELSKENQNECLKDLKNILLRFLSSYKTNLEIYKITLINGYLPKNTNKILKEFQKNNILEFDREIRKNSFYISYKYYKKDEIKYKVKIK